MFDFENIMKKNMDKVFAHYNIDTDPIYSNQFRKGIRWFAYKFSPFVLNIASFIILVWILNKINTAVGFEKTIIVVSVIVIFTLRSIGKSLNPDFD